MTNELKQITRKILILMRNLILLSDLSQLEDEESNEFSDAENDVEEVKNITTTVTYDT